MTEFLRNTPARRVGVLLATLTLVATCAGCGDADQGVTGVTYPDWIEEVHPEPGSETTAVPSVQIYHGATAVDEQVRLSIDGTDVTTYATGRRPGLLEYDVHDEAAPIDVEPGEHTATAQLYRVEPGATEWEAVDPEVHELIDEFTWTFRVL